MSQRITIRIGDRSAEAELNDCDCAKKIWAALPIEAVANTWGEEVYFDISVRCELSDDAREDVAVGELGYWPTGTAFCIFFGRTPASGPDGRPRAASKVNPIGHLIGDARVFEKVRDGEKIVLSGKT
ncbi:MAG TPA: cyclophilin-like fold protein [Phycisphaerae bacterium]|nr:cyclophilin-like fold protein [Phycisphaerae bacterium]